MMGVVEVMVERGREAAAGEEVMYGGVRDGGTGVALVSCGVPSDPWQAPPSGDESMKTKM